MHRTGTRLAALGAALTVGALAPGAAAAAAPATSSSAPSTSSVAPSTSSGSTSARQVPPPAPAPTASGNSPDAPDPHPPRGGLNAQGQPVGGAQLLSRGLVLPADAPPLPSDLTAQAWVLSDLDTGTVIAARDPHGRYQAASIQKLLTTVTLLPLLPGDRQVTVSAKAANTEGSHAGLVAGGHYTVDQLFQGLLLVSGNDCAEALAAAAGGRAKTVAMMNREALGLGAVDTFVQTPSGLDGWQQLTSAYDMTLFLRAALNQPRFVAYDRAATATLPVQRAQHIDAITLDNQNEQFLSTVKGALVAKTGYTDAALHTFAGAISRHGHRYGIIFLRAQRWPDDQWVQATKLVEWAEHLPAGTAPVGTLVAPRPSPRPSAVAHRTAPVRNAAAVTRSDGGSVIPEWLEVLVIAVGGSMALAGTAYLVRTR